MTPFVLTRANQFRTAPPPPLDNPEYTAAFDEVKSLGGDGDTTPTARTDAGTEIGIYWAYDGVPQLCAPPRLYNQIAQVIADQEGNTEYENARLFAMINVAMADAGIVGWGSKYEYDFWRPVIGIREGDHDGNQDTTGVPGWRP